MAKEPEPPQRGRSGELLTQFAYLREPVDLNSVKFLGNLSSGRSMYQLQGSAPERYGFVALDQGNQVIPLDPEAITQVVNSYLEQINVPPISSLPKIYLVFNQPGTGEQKPDHKTKAPLIQIIDADSAADRSELKPYFRPGIQKPDIDMAAIDVERSVHLEDNLHITDEPIVEGRRKFVIVGLDDNRRPATFYSPHYRRCHVINFSDEEISKLFPGLKSVNKTWREMYAREIWRRMIASAVSAEASDITYGLVGISREESDKATLSLDDWRKSLLANQPPEFWSLEFTSMLASMHGANIARKKAGDFPPHMQISTEEQKVLYVALSQLAQRQQTLYKNVARRRSLESARPEDATTTITPFDIRQARLTATLDEIENVLREMDQATGTKTDNWETYGRFHVSLTGLPEAWATDLEPYLKSGLDKSQPLLAIDRSQTVPPRADNLGMFGRALGADIPPAEQIIWGGEIHSPLSPDEVVEAMKWQAREPLFEILPNYDQTQSGRAAQIWKALTSAKIEEKGSNVRTPEGERKCEALIEEAVAQGKPIDVLVFGPWGLAPAFPRTGGRINPHLGHLDYLIRLHRINSTIEQVYKPGKGIPAVRFSWVNESDAFIDPGLLDSRVLGFEAHMLGWLQRLNSGKEVIHLHRMGELMWDTPTKRAIYGEFQSAYSRELRSLFAAFERGELNLQNHSNLERLVIEGRREPFTEESLRSLVREKKALLYPIATIIDPFKYIDHATPMQTILSAYELVRARIQGYEPRFRRDYGHVLDAQTEAVADALLNVAREIVIQHYGPIMDSRYITPYLVSPESAEEFERENPWKDLYNGKIHGRITDGGKDRWWVRINSGHDAVIHPTHGLPVVHMVNKGRKPTMTTRTMAEIMAESGRYVPVYLRDDDQNAPFHFIQLR